MIAPERSLTQKSSGHLKTWTRQIIASRVILTNTDDSKAKSAFMIRSRWILSCHGRDQEESRLLADLSRWISVIFKDFSENLGFLLMNSPLSIGSWNGSAGCISTGMVFAFCRTGMLTTIGWRSKSGEAWGLHTISSRIEESWARFRSLEMRIKHCRRKPAEKDSGRTARFASSREILMNFLIQLAAEFFRKGAATRGTVYQTEGTTRSYQQSSTRGRKTQQRGSKRIGAHTG